MKIYKLYLLLSSLCLLFTIVSNNPGSDIPCFQPFTGDIQRSTGSELVTFNISLINVGSENVDYISISQAHFVEGTCGYHIYLNIDHTYVLFEIDFTCNWTLQSTQSSQPIITFESYGAGSQFPDPYTEDIPYSLPSSFTGIIFHTYFSHLVAEGTIEGSCVGHIDEFVNPQNSVVFTVKVNGCPKGRYGTHCSHICSCAEGIQCHSFNGVCMCPKGLIGNRCDVVDPYIEVDSGNIYVEWGSDITLECIAHGITNPGSLISWERDGRRLPTNISRIHAEYSPMPLRIVYFINNMTDALNDEYVCIVNETLAQRVNVTAIGLPEPFIAPPLNHTVVEGQNVSLTCKVRENAGTVKWTRYNQDLNNDTALQNTNKTRVLFDKMARLSTLTIMMAELSDETSYRCYVGHTFQKGDVNFVEAYVSVIVQPLGDYPVIVETTNADMFSVLEHDLISVTCAVYGVKPTPELTWTLGGDMIDDQYQTIEVTKQGGKFTVKNALKLQAHSGDNSKELTCIADSDFFSSAKQSIQLNVSYAPKIYIEPESINILEGDKLTVNCNGSSNPTHIAYRWECSKPNGDVIHQVGQTFSVQKVTSDFDQSSLRCNASNGVGTSQVVLKAINISGTGPHLEIILPVTMFFLFGSVLVIMLVYLRKKRTTIPHIKLEQQKEFDVFISYKGGTDEEIFVIRILVPKLEEFGYKVCVHYKHFVGGKTIIENINESISRSHMTIIVLSAAFVESVWCKFEFQSASTQMPNFENNVIPVMFDDVTHLPNLDKTLKDLLKRVNYITWPRNCENDDASERQFWKLIRKALRPTVNPESLMLL